MLRRKHCSAKGHAIKTAVPYGFEKVEYLESSGTQYILSDLICKGYIKAATKFMSLSDGNGFIFGHQNNPNLNQCGILINSQTWDGLSLFHTLDAKFFTNIETNKIYNVDFSSQECVLNGIDLSKTIGDLRIVKYPGVIALFARTEDNVPRHFLTGRIYYIKITNQEGESIEMSPTLDRTGTPCMFDLVTRKKFYNAGTGQFKYTLPNGLPGDYTKVEYLENPYKIYSNDYTAYFDLGRFDVDLQRGDVVKFETIHQIPNIPDSNWTHSGSEGFNEDGTTLAIQHRKQMRPIGGGNNDTVVYNGWSGSYDCAGGNYGTWDWAAFKPNQTHDTNWHTIILEHSKDIHRFQLDDYETESETRENKKWINKPKLFVFGVPQSPLIGRKKHFKFWINGVLTRNLIPCLDPTGTPCMYDTVTQTPYYNSGTDDFLYPSPTSSATYSLRRPRAEYAKMTDTGVRRLYHVPADYDGSIENYANEHGFKLLNETESPNEEGKYYAFRWVETDTELRTEWYETEPPIDEFGEMIENTNEPQASTFNLRRPAPIDTTVYSNKSQWAMMTDTGVRRLYHTPKGYEGTLEDYAIQNGFKQLVETESPNEEGKYYSFKWVETDDTLTTEWFEIDPPQEEFFEENLDNPIE